MKTIFFIFTLFIVSFVNSQDSITQYYNEIAYRAEFVTNGTPTMRPPKKWKTDVKIFVMGTKDSVTYNELLKVVDELNELITPIEIKIVNEKSQANLIAFFGLCAEYDKIEPQVVRFSGYNYGLACIFSDENNDYSHGSFYVDVVRCDWLPPDEAAMLKKHIVREELTQSLGLMNDSMKYPNSIFYEGWSMTTEFTNMDKEIIKLHYNK